jgi:hypothetical protein
MGLPAVVTCGIVPGRLEQVPTEMRTHAKYIMTLGKIASFALRDGQKIAKNGGALAGNV